MPWPLAAANKKPPEIVLTIVLLTVVLFDCAGIVDPYGVGVEYGFGLGTCVGERDAETDGCGDALGDELAKMVTDVALSEVGHEPVPVTCTLKPIAGEPPLNSVAELVKMWR
jgi:hypothetical protein